MGYDLPTTDGHVARVLFPGRAGGPVGPDFRDAVIELDGQRVVGDIELHLRAANWYSHQHQTDPRYDHVILHAVAHGPLPAGAVTRLASGAIIPVVLLDDPSRFALPPAIHPTWPCQTHPLFVGVLTDQLAEWGRIRFSVRVARFHAALATANLDAVLLSAITESLSYGRELYRMSVRQRITEGAGVITESTEQNRTGSLDALSARRLQGLAGLAQGWSAASVGAVWCGAVLAGGTREGWERLLRVWGPAGRTIGHQRGAIVLWNAVLPVLAAYGDACGNMALASMARQIAWSAPGLPGNAITRAMTRWLGLPRTPSGALAQQGLQHLHAQWCRTKDCATCPAHVRQPSL